MTGAPAILGMPLDIGPDSPIPAVQPVCGFVVIKALNEDGDVCYLTAATDGLTGIECLGMVRYATLKLERRLFEDDED